VVGGRGTFTASGQVDDNDYVTAAATPDGKLVIAYLPVNRPVTIDMSKLSGPVRAQWYDPAQGSYVPIPGQQFGYR
jgi:hypothetical protein